MQIEESVGHSNTVYTSAVVGIHADTYDADHRRVWFDASGTVGGWLLRSFETSGIFANCALIALLWLMVATGMQASDASQK